jgi:UDP-N-acetylmuramate dehydrogenase
MIEQSFQEILHSLYPEVVVKQDESLMLHTAFKSGGAAKYFVSIDSLDHLQGVVNEAWKRGIKVKIVGSGTNLIVGEKGFDGLVIKNNCRRFDLQGMKGKITNSQMKLSQGYLYAESGALMNQVVRYVIEQGFGGIEFCLGLPGTVGGAVAVNANFSKEDIRIGRAVYAGKILTKNGVQDVHADYFRFGFDTSALLSGEAVLLSVLFALYPEEKEKLWARADDAVKYRTETQPKEHVSGQTFRNMHVRIVYPNTGLPSDISFVELIEKAGLKGKRIGAIGLWEENPHYLLNFGGGSAEDVGRLIKELKETLFRKFGVQLDMIEHTI